VRGEAANRPVRKTGAAAVGKKFRIWHMISTQEDGTQRGRLWSGRVIGVGVRRKKGMTGEVSPLGAKEARERIDLPNSFEGALGR